MKNTSNFLLTSVYVLIRIPKLIPGLARHGAWGPVLVWSVVGLLLPLGVGVYGAKGSWLDGVMLTLVIGIVTNAILMSFLQERLSRLDRAETFERRRQRRARRKAAGQAPESKRSSLRTSAG